MTPHRGLEPYIGLFLVVLTGLLASCGEASDSPDPALIGPQGGTYTDRGVTLSIPPDALSETVRLSVQPVDTPVLRGFESAGVFVRLEPSQVELAAPVELSYTLDPQALPEGREAAEAVLLLATEFDAPFTALDTEYDPKTGRLTAFAQHLGLAGPAVATDAP